ncbi:MAG: aldehyde dehydrogenase family protein [Phycisphaerales bacterium]|nr:aldehyde dehydrogenase family protein [Phycisphaerales bacterium]
MSEAVRRGLLTHEPSDFIGGRFRPLASVAPDQSSELVSSHDPAEPTVAVWSGAAQLAHVDLAVAAGRAAGEYWRATGDANRRAALRALREAFIANEERIARLITLESGKTLSESRLEAKALAEKITITLEPLSGARVSGFEFEVTSTRRGVCAFRPHGVMVVVGPFNFPAHLPNGHFIPALLAGNTVVFKPSERTPAVGQLLAECADSAGIPLGVFNVIAGGPRTAAKLCDHPDVDGILFTGSWPTGRRILEANIDRPGRMIALEMGGSNAAIVCGDAHLKQAVIECVRSAFATAGQRCTCTRRIIVDASIADAFIALFAKVASTLVVGAGDSKDPVFMGPLISSSARDAVLNFQERRARAGSRVILQATRLDRAGWFLTPGILQVARFELSCDEEVFGPLVQISVSTNDEDAIAQANASQFGLAAAVFTASRERWQRIAPQIRAGCINWNVGTAGASSRLPFGGFGRSGNNRPAGAFSLDYCGAAIAHLEEQSDAAPLPQGMRPF